MPLAYKQQIVINACVLLLLSCLCALIYYIVADFTTDSEQLTQFRYQLVAISIISTLITSSCLFFYKRKHAKANTSKSSTSTSRRSLSSLQILAVDDNAANRLIIKSYLSTKNINVILASSGAEAVTVFQQSIAQQQPLDLILMDIEMSDMDGLETTQAIRTLEKKSSRIPIIAVSAHNENKKKLQALAAGLDDYLPKPVEEKQLFTTIERWSNIAAITSKEILPTHPPTHSKIDTKAAPTPKTSTLPLEKTDKCIDVSKSLHQCNHNKALARDMLQLLIEMISEERSHILQHHQNQDWELLYQLNHKIYGGSSYCGVPQLQQANKKIEKLLQQKIHFNPQKITEKNTSDNESDELHNIDQSILALIKSIDDIIVWEEGHDIAIVFGIEEE
jgi:two-component system sensor histidine kinase BarA